MISCAVPSWCASGLAGFPYWKGMKYFVVSREGAGDLDGAVRALVAVAEDDLGAEEPQQADPFLARVVGDHDGEAVALARGDHRQRDAGVADWWAPGSSCR